MAAFDEGLGDRERRLHVTARPATGDDGIGPPWPHGEAVTACRLAIPISNPAPIIATTSDEPP